MPALGTGYSTAGTVTALVRSLLNDAAGSVFSDSVLLPYVNAAYRHVNSELGNIQASSYIKDNVLLILPAVAATDPGVQTVLSNAGYNNGTQNYTSYSGKVLLLPSDLLVPQRLWERASGSTDEFSDMTDMTDAGGLPSIAQGQSLRHWEWRAEGISFLGATADRQIRMRYEAAFMDMTDASSPMLIRDGQNAVAYKTAELAGSARAEPEPGGVTQAQVVFKPLFDEALEILKNRTAMSQQHVGIRRQPYSRGRNFRMMI